MQGINGRLLQEGADRTDMKCIRASFAQGQDANVTGTPGVGWGGDAYVDSWGFGETAGQREAAVSPPFSLHPLFASSPFLTAIRWLPVSRQMQKAGGGGEVGTELIFTSLLEAAGADPSAYNTAPKEPKNKIPILLPNPNSFKAVTPPPVPSQETQGFAKPL